jgi:hypothetical protein
VSNAALGLVELLKSDPTTLAEIVEGVAVDVGQEYVKNLGLAPRVLNCFICRKVAHPEDVTVRLFEADGLPKKRSTEAVDYLMTIGLPQSRRQFQKHVKKHVAHIVAYALEPHDLAPIERENAQVMEPPGPRSWIDTTDMAMDVGADALRMVRSRLEGMDDKDLIAAARIGLTAAGQRATSERRGAGKAFDGVLRALGAGAHYRAAIAIELEGGDDETPQDEQA